MKSIKHVLSMEHYGCVITCIAMITRTPYFQVREKLSKVSLHYRSKIMDLQSLMMNGDEIRDLLMAHFNIRCKIVKFISPMKNHCILLIMPLYWASASHAVVWDGKQKKILDPDGEIANLDNFNIYYCIEILPPKKGLEVDQRGKEKYWRFNGVGPRIKLTRNGQIDYILEDLSLTKDEHTALSRNKRIDKLTKAIGMTESKIKQKLRESDCICV